MKILAINGSPRRKGNTATLLNEIAAGAKTQNAEVELINLYDLNFKGCVSCFACKRIGGKSFGKCAYKDDLLPVLQKIEEVDAMVIGTPIYFSGETGTVRSFMERLQFQYMLYDKEHTNLTPKKIKTALVCTMNVTEESAKLMQYERIWKTFAGRLQHFFGSSETLLSYDTYQFDDYSKYAASVFDVEDKKKQRDTAFPQDKEKAFQLGISLTQ